MTYAQTPDRIEKPMTPAQTRLLRNLAEEACQPRQFEKSLTRDQAEQRIKALRSEIALADSF